MLQHPDFSKPFILDTTTGDSAIGAVLSQTFCDIEYVIAYICQQESFKGSGAVLRHEERVLCCGIFYQVFQALLGGETVLT